MKSTLYAAICALLLAACGSDAGTPSGEPPVEPPGPGPAVVPEYFSTGFMKGSTMCFAQYMQDMGLVYRENGVPRDPYASMKEHGANIVRLQLNYEPFGTFGGAVIDWASWRRVLADARRAKANGLDILLTLKPDADDYSSPTVVHNLVPADWKSAASSETKLGDKLHDWVYEVLCDLAAEEIYPRVVAVGNEVNVNFLGVSQSADASRTGRLLARGFAAVREYAAKYNPNVSTLLHIADPSTVAWTVATVRAAGCTDFDFVGVSWYPGTNIGHRLGGYASIGAMCSSLKQNYGCDAMVIETAYTFTTGSVGGEWMGDYCDNAYNYPDWDDASNAANYTPAAQRAWLAALAGEIRAAGGAGLVTWGTESLPDLRTGKAEGHGTGLYTYPASWAYGSTWENNSYWDFTRDNNLHEGIDWMSDVQ